MREGKVYIVGAGPGDPGLITVRGVECIRSSDALVYDRLVAREILKWARSGVELHYVGKAPGRHLRPQEEINRLLVQLAREGKTVTRLKGGDPFVFGRGGEEVEALADAGVHFEVIPGVTSAVAVPAYAGIPITHRAFTSSLGIFTAQEGEAKRLSGLHWDKIATGLGTLVFLMGTRQLETIATKLIEHGRDPDTPVAVVRWGTTPCQQTVTGTLADITGKARAAGIQPPTVIVVGEVAGLHNKLKWFAERGDSGKCSILDT